MWVQEGVDCKDSDEIVSSTFTPMLTRFHGQCQRECDSKAADDTSLKSLDVDPQYQALSMTMEFDKALTLSSDIDADMDMDMDIDLDIDKELDLTVYGKKMESISISPTSALSGPPQLEPGSNSFAALENTTCTSDVCSIASENDWNECMRCAERGSLLVVELYCSVFGPSAMYNFVTDRLSQGDKSNTKLAQLSITKMQQIAQCKKVIANCDSYTPSPIPSFVLLKNGVQIDTLEGIRPLDLLRLIERHSTTAASVEEQDRAAQVDFSQFTGLRGGDMFKFVQQAGNGKKI